jgi:hypothetical protein
MVHNAEEQVWLEDIVEQEEMALDCWKVTYNFYERLAFQQAPVELIQSMGEISGDFAAAYQKLKAIRERAYFPKENE